MKVALIAVVALVFMALGNEASAQCYSIQQTYVGATAYFATFSPWGNSVWFETDSNDPNYAPIWQTLVATKMDDMPIQIVFSGTGTNGSYHITAIQLC